MGVDVRLKNSEGEFIICDKWVEEGFYRIGIDCNEDTRDLDSSIILSKSELEAFVKNVLYELEKSIEVCDE